MKARMNEILISTSIAFTHMRAKLKQTVIATIGVTFGITVFIFMLSFITGTNEYTQDIVFENSPHLRLYNEATISSVSLLDEKYPDKINIVHHVKPKDILINLKDGNRAVQELEDDKRVLAVSGSISTQVFYRFGPSAINGMVIGVDFEKEDALFDLRAKLVDGSFHELTTIPNSLVMGVGLAKRLNVNTGDRLYVTTQNGNNFFVTIAGLFKTGLTELDNMQSYASLNTVQRFLRVPSSYITDIKLKLHDMEAAPEMTDELVSRYGYSGSDWKRDNSTLLEGEVLRNMITYGVAATILLVAGFGIFNILTMMIYEKMKDIAILKAMGFSDTNIRWIFLTQALVIGIAGALLGLLFGFLAAYGLSKMPFESDVMISMDHLPVSFNILYYVTGFTFGIITTALAGYFPSRNAANTDPIAILRG